MSQWPLNKAYFWETSPFFRLLIPLLAGIVCYYQNWLSLQPAPAIVAALIAMLLLFFLSLIRRAGGNTFIGFIGLHLFIFLAGYLLSYYNDVRNDSLWFGHALKNAGAYKVVVTDKPQEKAKTWKIGVNVKHAIGNGDVQHVKGKAFIYVYKNEGIRPYATGDELLIPAKWQSIRNAGNPFEFDYKQYAARNNLFYQQFLSSKEIVLYRKAIPGDISWVTRFHEWCMLQLETYIPDQRVAGLMQAMVVGDEANLDADIRQSYAETGIIHIIAISGSHLTMFFFLIAFVMSGIRNKKYEWLKYILAIPLIWAYVMVAGAPSSAVRAALMFTILGLGFAWQKQANPLNHLFATAFVLLLVNPAWLYAVGFQLSFVAVLSILLFYAPIYRLVPTSNIILRKLWAAAAVSIAAEILVAPLVVYYFHLFPLMFVVANVAAYLFMGVVLVLGMLIILLSSLAAAAKFLAAITIWLVNTFEVVVNLFKEMNPASFRVLKLEGYELILVYAFFAMVALYALAKKRHALLGSIAIFAMLLGSFCNNHWQALRQERLVVYAVNGSNHIELIKGATHYVLHTDTAMTPVKWKYAVEPAHVGYRATEGKTNRSAETMFVGKHSFVILVQPFDMSKPMVDVEYIVLGKGSDLTIKEIKSIFRPAKVIFGSDIPRRRLEALMAEAQQENMPVHNIRQDGAFVLSSF